MKKEQRWLKTGCIHGSGLLREQGDVSEWAYSYRKPSLSQTNGSLFWRSVSTCNVIVKVFTRMPPQAEIFHDSRHHVQWEMLIFKGFSNDFDPEIPKFSACGGLLQGNLIFPTFFLNSLL